jgi:UDP-glucose:(heptosyl)LPS alpha-1,3-glucosyltransferase
MKIAYVVHDYHRSGGHSRYVAELASRFAQSHEVHVFANRFEREAGVPIQFHAVPAWRATALTTILTFSIPAYLKVRGDYDIIHLQGFCGPKGNVITTHQCNEAWYRALMRFDSITWRDWLFRCSTSRLERRLYRNSGHAHIIAISKRVAQDIHDLYDCNGPTHIIYHGVDLEKFSPATRERYRGEVRRNLGLNPRDMVFLFVGNLRKGSQRCIRALSRLESGFLVIVSPSNAKSDYSLASETGCSDRVKFLGATDRVEQVFAAADAFLLPTPYDPFALVCTEAMACGLPVVVSREAGAAELIKHRVNGVLIEDVTSVEELAGHMRSLMQDRELATDLGRAGRKTVQPMSWDVVANQTMCVYEELLSRRA